MLPETFFRALSDATRLRSLMLLQSEGELCVCELTAALDVSQPKISRHLAQLRDIGITKVRREGTWVFYRISDDLPAWAARVLEETFEGTRHTGQFHEDQQRLTGMAGRPPRACCP
ncbi:metalloregulator ArsR/SmtB family transcription factor [Guyparkeria sp.]|uniref:metalloregulator ArsR/SmtB family transcription factor n=1 Tax=Guyparkeria sp. TaxID=2035736 RepID=UPI00356A00E6